MKIKHYEMNNDNLNENLFKQLLSERMYTNDGVLKSVYSYPNEYFEDGGYVSTLSNDNEIVSCLYLGKNVFHSWDWWYPEIQETYGLLGFYTKPFYRKRGYAKALFEDFDNAFKIRKLSGVNTCQGILSCVEPEGKIFIDDSEPVTRLFA